MDNGTCQHPTCIKPRYRAQPWCRVHYRRIRLHGDPDVNLRLKYDSLRDAVLAAVESTEDCWLAKPSRIDSGTGYASVSFRGRSTLAHRASYEAFIGPIPEGLQIDHLCRVRACLNPAHLEPVTCRENVLRSPFTRASINASRTHCPQGHGYTSENTYEVRTRGGMGRQCKRCTADRKAISADVRVTA